MSVIIIHRAYWWTLGSHLYEMCILMAHTPTMTAGSGQKLCRIYRRIKINWTRKTEKHNRFMHWLEMKWEKWVTRHTIFNGSTRGMKTDDNDRKKEIGHNFPFKIFSQFDIISTIYVLCMILMSGKEKKTRVEVNTFFPFYSFNHTKRHEMEQNETSLVSWLNWWPVSNTSSFLCVSLCFCCLISFSWRIFFSIRTDSIRCFRLAAIVVAPFKCERNCVAISLWGLVYFFFYQFS